MNKKNSQTTTDIQQNSDRCTYAVISPKESGITFTSWNTRTL